MVNYNSVDDLPPRYREQAEITLKSERERELVQAIETANPTKGYQLVVLGKPHSKARPRFNMKTGHVYTPPKTIEAERKIKRLWEKKYGITNLDKPLKVTIRFAFEIPRNQGKIKAGSPYTKHLDVDNLCKLVLDALNKVAYRDDMYITELHAVKYYDRESYTVIEIAEVSD